MRKSKFSDQEVAELDETKAKDVRKGGFKIMSVRDRGWARLSSGETIHWHSNEPYSSHDEIDGHIIEVKNDNVPDGTIMIRTQHGNIMLDAEELMRFIRWA